MWIFTRRHRVNRRAKRIDHYGYVIIRRETDDRFRKLISAIRLAGGKFSGSLPVIYFMSTDNDHWPMLICTSTAPLSLDQCRQYGCACICLLIWAGILIVCIRSVLHFSLARARSDILLARMSNTHTIRSKCYKQKVLLFTVGNRSIDDGLFICASRLLLLLVLRRTSRLMTFIFASRKSNANSSRQRCAR